jgi:hypothetical protein
METIKNTDININRHTVDGYTLTYLTDSGHYYRRRYVDYPINVASALFKAHIYTQEGVKARHGRQT